MDPLPIYIGGTNGLLEVPFFGSSGFWILEAQFFRLMKCNAVLDEEERFACTFQVFVIAVEGVKGNDTDDPSCIERVVHNPRQNPGGHAFCPLSIL